jgi:hypothetical protein
VNETLQKRVLLGSATVVAVSYFLPWMSIMTPLGTIELKGQFLDYAWILLALSLLYLIAQIAKGNAEAFGIPSNALPALVMIQRLTPFILLSFMIWTGTNFEFGLRSGTLSSILGTDSAEIGLHAGLDYGYWLGLLASASLVTVTAVQALQTRLFAGIASGILVLASLIAYAHNRPARILPTSRPALLSGSFGEPSSIPAPIPKTDFDSSPYVIVESVIGQTHAKNYEASRYSDSLDISLRFKNLTDKTITGLRGRVSVLDGFGNVVYSFGFRDDDKISPKSAEGRGAYNFDHNEFEDDDPYSKMCPLIRAETAKYEVTISNIAFADATTLPK